MVGRAREVERWCDWRAECSCNRIGERTSYRRDRKRWCWRGQAEAIPEGTIAGMTGGGEH